MIEHGHAVSPDILNVNTKPEFLLRSQVQYYDNNGKSDRRLARSKNEYDILHGITRIVTQDHTKYLNSYITATDKQTHIPHCTRIPVLFIQMKMEAENIHFIVCGFFFAYQRIKQ